MTTEFIQFTFKKNETADLETKIKLQLNNNLYHNDINAITKDLKTLFDAHYKRKQNNNPDHKRLGTFIFYYILKSNKNKKHWRILKDFINNYPKTISINAIKRMVEIGQMIIELSNNNSEKFEELIYIPYSEIYDIYTKHMTLSELKTYNSNEPLELLKDIYDVMKKHFEK